MQQIERLYGKGSIMRYGDNAETNVEAIPTGSLALDVALGLSLIHISVNGKKVNIPSYLVRVGDVIEVKDSSRSSVKDVYKRQDVEKLYVSQVFATPGPILKRIMPRAQGRAYRINKRTSHVTLAVAEKA